jgi:tol-pal system protein YbgF
MRRLHLIGLVGLGTLSLASSSWGQAVAVDATSLNQRLSRIEQRLNSMGGGASVGGGTATGYTAADLESRMTSLEEENGRTSGSVERINNAIERLAKRMDDWQKDLDMRMGDIETRLTKLEQRPAETAAVAVPAAAANSDAATGTGTPVQSVLNKGAASSSPKKPEIPAAMSPTDHYNKAYAYLTAADYPNAQHWLEEFIKRYPTNALADNAHYWLGEVYLVQNNPTNAAVEFRNGLKAFPKGAKAPANMFKMGVALEQLKKPDLAKATWEQLIKTYPSAPESARAKEKLLQLKQAATKQAPAKK